MKQSGKQQVIQTSQIKGRYEYISLISQSKLCTLELFRKPNHKKQYVCKTFQIGKMRASEKAKIREEIDKYQGLGLKGIVKVDDYEINAIEVVMIGKRYNKKMFKDRQKHPQNYDRDQLKNIFLHLINEIAQMHKVSVTHNNINIDELYLNHGQTVLGMPTFKAILQLQEKYWSKSVKQTSHVFSSPQRKKGYGLSKSSDIWDLGLVFMQLVNGQLLEGQEGQVNKLEENINQIKNIHFRELIEGMLNVEGQRRMTIEQVKQYLQASKQDHLPSKCLNQLSLQLPIADLLPFNHSSPAIFRDQNLEMIQLLQVNNIKCFKVVNTHCKPQGMYVIYTLTINQKIQQFHTLIKTSNIHQRSRPLYFQHISDLTDLLNEQNSQLKVNDSAQLYLEINQKRLLNQINILGGRNYKKLKRISRTMVLITNQKLEHYDGLIVGYGMILTSSRAVINHESGFRSNVLKIECKLDNLALNPNTNALINFILGQSNQDQNSQYAVLQPQEQQVVVRMRYMPVVCEYTQSETVKKIDQLQYDVRFHYQAGDKYILLPHQITFGQHGLFTINNQETYQVAIGCPLLVVFSNNQCYSIGMFHSSEKGTLFDEQFYWNLWRTNKDFHSVKGYVAHSSALRLRFWQDVSLSTFLARYKSHTNLQDGQYEKQSDYEIPGMISPSSQWFLIANQLRKKILTNIDRYEYVDRFAQMIKQQYGEDRQSLSNFYYEVLVFRYSLSRELTIDESMISYYKLILQYEGQKPINIQIVCTTVMLLGQIYMIIFTSSTDEATRRQYLELAFDVYNSHQKWIQKFNHPAICKVIYEKMLLISNFKQDHFGSIKYGQLLEQIYFKQKNIRCLEIKISIVKIRLELRLFKLAANGLLQCYLITGSQGFRHRSGLMINQISNLSTTLNAEVLRANDVDLQTVDTCFELLQKMDPEKSADFAPIFEDKKRRIIQMTKKKDRPIES